MIKSNIDFLFNNIKTEEKVVEKIVESNKDDEEISNIKYRLSLMQIKLDDLLLTSDFDKYKNKTNEILSNLKSIPETILKHDSMIKQNNGKISELMSNSISRKEFDNLKSITDQIDKFIKNLHIKD